MNIYFGDDSCLELQRLGGHFYVTIRAVYAGGSIGGAEIDFILDTGAFMTVVSRDLAERFGYDKLPKSKTIIKGYAGEESADFVRIPSLKILEPLLTDVPVLIPHSKELEQNILGLNVLEYFNYYIDAENDRLFLNLNPNPRPYNELLACGRIYTLKTEGEI
jgi:clan AA aspartic protease (TIGR02281 family)